ncbi:MAG TPA: lipid II flippase MurJ, partial [Clostridia bacterium]
KGLRAVLLPAIPSAIGLIVLKEPILTAIFKWNANFNESALPLTGNILMLFSTALITQSIVAVMNRGFYADNDTTTPLLVGIGTIVLNYILGFTFVHLTGFEAAGMALSYSIISLINAILLGFILKRRMKLSFKGIYIFALKVLAAAAVMGLTLYVLLKIMPAHSGVKAVQLLLLGTEVFLGGLVFFAFSHLLKVNEVIRYSLSLKHKFKKKKNSD